MTPATLSPKLIANDKPIDPAEIPHISTCTEMTSEDMNVPTQDNKYPWLDPNDKQQKEEFLTKLDDFHDVFSLRDEIGTCPFIEVHQKLKDETPSFIRPYPMREEQKKVIQKEMDRLEHLGIIRKGLTGYSSPVVLVKRKKSKSV